MTDSFSTNTQLEKLAWSLRIPLDGIYWLNKLPRLFNNGCAYIINLQSSEDEGYGTHWVAVAVDKDGHIHYFDSFGAPPPMEVEELAITRPFSHSTQLIQNPRSGYCGLYCILFLAAAFNRLPLAAGPTMSARIQRYNSLFSQADITANKTRLLKLYERLRPALTAGPMSQ